MRKRLLSILLGACMIISFASCGSNEETASADGGAVQESASGEAATLNIAYQYGLAYAPLIICKEQGLIEQAYEEATGKEVTVVWTQMSSGADINTGIASGDINVGFMGIAPAITGVTKNVGYKIFTNLSGQEHGLMTNDESILGFDDLIGSSNQIALVNVGSIQHIILAKALDDSGYDAHALDSNIVAMKHPDGMTALETGNISCHLTTNPYIYKERGEEDLFEIDAVAASWSKENSFIVGVAAESLYEEEPELYQALCKAVSDSIDYVNTNTEEAAKLTCEFDGNTEADELKYLQEGIYTVETKGVFELASFMARTEFIDKAPETYSDLAFDNVVGD